MTVLASSSCRTVIHAYLNLYNPPNKIMLSYINRLLVFLFISSITSNIIIWEFTQVYLFI